MLFRKNATNKAEDADGPSVHREKIGKRVTGKLQRNPMVERVDGKGISLFLRPDFASADECEALRKIIDAGAQPSKLFSGTEGPDYRTSSSCRMDPLDPQVRAINDRIEALTGLDAATGEMIQGQRYRPGEEYKPHWDYFPVNDTYWPHMRAQGGQRCWTAMLYLSDVPAGGETHFAYAELLVPPREGTLLVWNNLKKDGAPNRDSLHAARPVKEGAKYVLTKWFRERDWIANP